MTSGNRVHRWNEWYARTPQEWRFQAIVWLLIAVGALNMLLTIAVGFPFGLLLLLAIACLAAIRAPYALGWIVPTGSAPSSAAGAYKFEIRNADRLIDLNQRYDALPEAQRVWLPVAILLVTGAVNMLLTIEFGFPFGLLLLLVLLALVVVRAPYVAGVFKPFGAEEETLADVPSDRSVEHAP